MPTLAGAFEHDSSSGYDDTAGAINLLEIWHDGLSVLYAWSQFETAVPVLLVGAEVSAADRHLVTLTFSGDLDESSEPSPSDFTLVNSAGADSITAVSISGSTVELTRTRSEATSTIRVTYEKGANPLKSDATGLDVMEFTARAVAFEPAEPAALELVRLPNIDGNVTETANGDGWDYSVEVSNSAYNTCYARSTVALQAGEDGYFLITMGDNDMVGGPIIGFTTDDEADWYQDVAIAGVQIYALGYYGVLSSASLLQTPDVTTVAPATGHVLKFERSGTDLVFSLSTDDGETFTEFNRETGLSAAALYILVQLGAINSKVTLPRVSGVWA